MISPILGIWEGLLGTKCSTFLMRVLCVSGIKSSFVGLTFFSLHRGHSAKSPRRQLQNVLVPPPWDDKLSSIRIWAGIPCFSVAFSLSCSVGSSPWRSSGCWVISFVQRLCEACAACTAICHQLPLLTRPSIILTREHGCCIRLCLEGLGCWKSWLHCTASALLESWTGHSLPYFHSCFHASVLCQIPIHLLMCSGLCWWMGVSWTECYASSLAVCVSV